MAGNGSEDYDKETIMLTSGQRQAIDDGCARLGQEVVNAAESQAAAQQERHVRRAAAEAVALGAYLDEMATLLEIER